MTQDQTYLKDFVVDSQSGLGSRATLLDFRHINTLKNWKILYMITGRRKNVTLKITHIVRVSLRTLSEILVETASDFKAAAMNLPSFRIDNAFFIQSNWNLRSEKFPVGRLEGA